MVFILSILLSLALALIFRKGIKKYSVILYIAAIAISVLCLLTKMKLVVPPEFIGKIIIRPFTKAIIPTAIFTIVMYIGALDKKNPAVKKLFTIRGELSIIACILTLGHNVSYGYRIFPTLFTNPLSMKLTSMLAAITSVILIIIMIPLMVTSFICVRKKMKAQTWKKIQRWAYVFYMLIYVHVMLLLIPKLPKSSIFDIVVYSVIFLGYAVLRIRKYLNDNKVSSK